MIVYKATAPNGKAYIGRTRQRLCRRRHDHIKDVRRGSRIPFHCAIREFGADKFVWEVLRNAGSIAEADWLERNYIDRLNTMIPNGYNATTGGTNCTFCEEAKAALSAAQKGKPKCAGHGAKVSAALKGKPKSEAHKAAMRKPKSAEHRAAMSAAAKKRWADMPADVRTGYCEKLAQIRFGKKHSPETKAKISAKLRFIKQKQKGARTCITT